MPGMGDTAGLKRAVETRAGFIAHRLAIDIDAELHRNAQQHNQTGHMIAAIRTTHARMSPTLWRITASVPVIQAATTDRGARPHVIAPRHASVLRWTSGGKTFFARKVNHPGNKGSRWFSKVMNPSSVYALLSRFVGR